ncbi:HetP family heterocyst commitment protein [Cylindrospermum sp. FACHB-282]|uniref:HetP family heterocyst commitment protein n=1 Tax=Cylindrospermum sp. FACHB-282 TaxID=2692794 RepID=UPI0016866F9F|nr:HetP family heterocyst commitment protein [Cylindrospermum sp. FACHB-282]MBD2386257.1 HetP family heterocyst commitment protein [Cylindrospermum sp. FACHB-282]
MTQNITGYEPQLGKKNNTEEIEQIIKAIIAGKYSWACVLILRFGGYNPMDYIPYRTYIRLVKSNCLVESSKLNQTDTKKVKIFDLKPNWLRL